ncbi:MAG: 50S ribosome-binding GTPase [Deltaproteobacteria bacterium]|nr:50S ribosome-binding GTPase [Deltaproteobacteria bacterium]
MKHPSQLLQNELDQVIDLLRKPFFFSLSAEEKESLRAETQKLSQKLSDIEGSFLTIGLLGGTGVGKSTLMNALAGSAIASTSHRRPHTDNVLVYRHAAAPSLPAQTLADMPWHEVTHQVNAIQQVLLCDLPDFDSLMGEHREYVLSFLEHLDVLVWVTSPEKYADGRFYEFLKLVPKATQNFYFLLNKVDILFRGESQETGYEQMARIIRSFQEHITESGIAEPFVYTLSAEEALGSDQLAHWNQFPSFRQQIFQQRDMKQVKAIKAANIDVEVRQLLSAFQKEVVNLKAFEETLEDSLQELEEKRDAWVQAGVESIDVWLRRRITKEIVSRQSNPSSVLVGPGSVLASFFQQWQQRFADEPEIPTGLAGPNLPEEIAVPFRRRLEWVEDSIGHRILQKNLPSAFRERLGEILNVTKTVENIGEGFFRTLSLPVTKPSFWAFRGLQFLTYMLLFVFLLMVIGGETAWRDVLGRPGLTSIFYLLLAGIHTVFSTKGLAALGSYALLNLLFAIHFFHRYKKVIRRMTDRVTASLKVELGKVWQEELKSVSERLHGLRTDIQSQISEISTLQ